MSHDAAQYRPAASTDAPPSTLRSAVVEFARRASMEISTHDERLLGELVQRLPTGMRVYVAHPPKASLEDVVRVALHAQAAGFTASPHLVARRLPSERALRDALARLREHGIEQVLLVAGDLDRPLGPFSSTLEVIASGALQEVGLKRVGFAGHPEGHPAVDHAQLISALRAKQQFAERSGIAVHIVTQFGFNPEGVCAWERMLMQEKIALPVHVGIAGPTSLTKLLKFAVRCGVGTSVNSLRRSPAAVAGLAGFAIGCEQMLLGLLKGRAAYPGSRLIQPHVYALGGALASAEWLNRMMTGAFELTPDCERLTP